jgi:hypothetical protein
MNFYHNGHNSFHNRHNDNNLLSAFFVSIVQFIVSIVVKQNRVNSYGKHVQ